MGLVFNEKKTTQAAAQFLRLAGGSMNYMALIKHLYLLDRSALLQWGRLVSCADLFEMHLGPVLSQVHDLVTEMQIPDERSYWNQFISEQANYSVTLNADPGRDQLSEAEEKLISELFATYGHYKPFDLVDLLHKTLPELKGVPKGGRMPISVSDILGAEKKPANEISAIEMELESLGKLDAMFAAH